MKLMSPLGGALLVTGLVTLTACGSGSGSSGAASTTLKMAVVETAAVKFDPALQDVNSTYQLSPVYDTLLRQAADGTVQPNVVTEYTYESPTELSLSIRDDVVFSDGTTLDAEGVKANLEAVQEKKGPYAASLAAIKSIETPDAATVVLELSTPNPTLPNVLAGTAGMLVSPEAIDSASLATEPVGSGPYTLTSSAPGQGYKYEKRADYWNAGHYAYENLDLTVFADENAKLNALRSGQVDVAELGDNATVDQLAESGQIDYVAAPYNINLVLLSDRDGTLAKPLADVRVRQALNYAVDREAIAGLGGANNTPTAQLFRPGQAGYDESLDTRYPYDPDQAKALLAEAGYPNGFEADMVSSSYFDQDAQAAVGYFDAIGVKLNITNVPLADYIGAVTGTEYATSFFAYNINDVYSDTTLIAGPEGTFNSFRTKNDTIDAVLTEAAEATSPDELAANLVKVNTAMVDEAWFVPLYAVQFGLASKNVTGLSYDVTRPAPYYDWKASA